MLKCDTCDYEFDMQIQEDTVTVEDEECKRRYFRCPNCDETYTVMIYTKKLKQMMKSGIPNYIMKPELDHTISKIER